jgi:hypothetical protein
VGLHSLIEVHCFGEQAPSERPWGVANVHARWTREHLWTRTQSQPGSLFGATPHMRFFRKADLAGRPDVVLDRSPDQIQRPLQPCPADRLYDNGLVPSGLVVL